MAVQLFWQRSWYLDSSLVWVWEIYQLILKAHSLCGFQLIFLLSSPCSFKAWLLESWTDRRRGYAGHAVYFLFLFLAAQLHPMAICFCCSHFCFAATCRNRAKHLERLSGAWFFSRRSNIGNIYPFIAEAAKLPFLYMSMLVLVKSWCGMTFSVGFRLNPFNVSS